MADPHVSAHLEIRGFDCDPTAITTYLGVSPGQSWLRGEAFGGTSTRKYSGWRLMSPLVEVPDLERHVVWLLDRLPANIDLPPVCGTWEIQISLEVTLRDQSPAMYFGPATMARIAALGASLDIDVYTEPTASRME